MCFVCLWRRVQGAWWKHMFVPFSKATKSCKKNYKLKKKEKEKKPQNFYYASSSWLYLHILLVLLEDKGGKL